MTNSREGKGWSLSIEPYNQHEIASEKVFFDQAVSAAEKPR